MRIGFIGAGNMASAMIQGALRNGFCKEDMSAYDIDASKVLALGVRAAAGIRELAGQSDMIFLAVKPDALDNVLHELKEVCTGKAFISIVAGRTMDSISGKLPGARVLRVMPNTPLLVGEGAIALCANNTLTKEEMIFASDFFGGMGTVCALQEKLIDAVTGLSGSGPAYAFVFIEALADAGVMEGLPREVAYKLAAQTLAGAGRMALETGQVPAALKDAVTSPGGTTAAGLYALEKAGFRAAAMDAVHAATRRSKEMSGK